MAQHSGSISNDTGANVRADVNNALAAINSNNSGSSDPSTTYAYQFYADTGDNTFKIRNAANDGFINISITGGLGTENFGLAPLSGATFTGTVKLNDNVKAIFGTGDDLEIFHDGTHSRIKDVGTGNLFISGTNTQLINAAGSETIAKFTEDGPVELFFNGTKTFETTASGFSAIGGTFTGDVKLNDNVKAVFGTGDDLEIFHDSANSFIKDSGTGGLIINTDAFQIKDQNNSTFALTAVPTSFVKLFFNNSNKLETTNSGVDITGTCTATTFSGSGASLTSLPAGQLTGALPAIDGSNLTNISAGGVGGNTGIDFNDDVAIRFGGSNDGVIQYVSSTDAFTISTADGADIKLDSDDDLTIECDDDMNIISGDGIALKHGTSASSENMIVCNDDSSVVLYHNGLSRLTTDVFGVVINGGIIGVGVGQAVATLRDLRGHETNGGTFSSGADRVRVLNSVEHDGESFVTLNTTTGEFTLPTGAYMIYFEAVAFDVNNHRAKIVTDGGSTVLTGLNARSAAADATMTTSSGFGRVFNSSEEGYFLKHRCSTTKSTSGFGQDMNYDAEGEFYARVVIFRMS